jgi:hypothetical protein
MIMAETAKKVRHNHSPGRFPAYNAGCKACFPEPALTLTVTIKGETLSDLEMAMDRIKGQVAEGYKTGSDRNGTGRYSYEVKGEEVDADGN